MGKISQLRERRFFRLKPRGPDFQALILRLKYEESFKLTIENVMVIAEAGTPVHYRRSLEFDFQKNYRSPAGTDNQDFKTTCQAG